MRDIVGREIEKELKIELKIIFDKIHGRAKSGTTCSSEAASFRWQCNSPPPAPAKWE